MGQGNVQLFSSSLGGGFRSLPMIFRHIFLDVVLLLPKNAFLIHNQNSCAKDACDGNLWNSRIIRIRAVWSTIWEEQGSIQRFFMEVHQNETLRCVFP